ncbi:histidine phosphatase family protein [Sporobolomyces salmoneus]|uniref:histidine phosphatase family protein n=1 Tax=Sporobolomyces salmoneus TaxID=183962 RepID=UPI00317D836E
MDRKVLVTILRHGETDHNKAGIIQGHLDTPLNAQGEAQARHTAKWFKENRIKFGRAYSSDLSRARLTAQLIMAEQEGDVELVQDERIRERFLGNLQGKRRGDPGTDRSTVEPADKLRARLFSFWDDLFPSISPSSSTPQSTTTPTREDEEEPLQVLVASHGASIREFIQALISERSEEYEVNDLPEGEEAMLRRGEKRIGNCARTCVEMTPTFNNGSKEVKWRGSLKLYADDTHFVDSSRAPSPRLNADIL